MYYSKLVVNSCFLISNPKYNMLFKRDRAAYIPKLIDL